ncbi:MAG TPA: NAD(P)/FAD-dependent oxidoreductase [Acidimicrobiia bacterium]|nr:NAD(P)/FAD-dependent oxidoreductase [Acidimicrobiia bacterium]
MSIDAVVVGAGPNGLTAAARIARAGYRVVVYEGADTIGGNTRTRELMVPGVVHDLGATVVPFAAASPAFAALGLDLPYRHSQFALAHPLDGGRAVVIDRQLGATAEMLGADASRYRRLIAPIVRHFDAFADSTLAPAIRQARHPLVAARFGPLALLPGTMFAGLFGTEEAKAVIVGLASHATVPADRPLTAGVGLTLLVAAHAVGWPMIEGGTQVLAEQLGAIVRAEGGEIIVDHEVRSLDELPAARVTLLDVTPRQLATIAPGASGAFRRWKYGPGVCKVDYVLSGPVPWTAEACRGAATVHLGGTAHEILDSEREVARGRVHPRPYTIVVQPQLADPTRGRPDAIPLWTYCHVPNGADVDASSAIEAQLDRFAPGWRDLVVARQVLTAAASEATNPNLVGGDISGGLMSIRQMLFGARPGRSPYATNIDGVYLCSSSTPPGAGAHGMSGWYAAGSALRVLR